MENAKGTTTFALRQGKKRNRKEGIRTVWCICVSFSPPKPFFSICWLAVAVAGGVGKCRRNGRPFSSCSSLFSKLPFFFTVCRKGIARSAKPYRRSAPSWLKVIIGTPGLLMGALERLTSWFLFFSFPLYRSALLRSSTPSASTPRRA